MSGWRCTERPGKCEDVTGCDTYGGCLHPMTPDHPAEDARAARLSEGDVERLSAALRDADHVSTACACYCEQQGPGWTKVTTGEPLTPGYLARQLAPVVADMLTQARTEAYGAGFAAGVQHAEARGWHLSDEERVNRARGVAADWRRFVDEEGRPLPARAVGGTADGQGT